MKKDQIAGTPAGFFVRMAAQILDTVVLGLILLVFGIIVAILIFLKAMSRFDVTILPVFFLVIPCFYYTLATGLKGQTLGKKIFNLKVVRMDGTTVSLFRSFLRWLSYFLSAIPLGLGYLFPVFQKDKRALHDMTCDTKVVETGPSNQVALVLVLCLVPFYGVGFIGILAAIAIPRFAQMLEKSREASTKANLAAIKSAVTIYFTDQGKYPQDLQKDLVGKYIDRIPPVKATGAFVAGGQSPAGDEVSLVEPGQTAPVGSGIGWLYDPYRGKVYVNSTVKDSKGVPYSFYGFE